MATSFGDAYKATKDFFGRTFSYDKKVEVKSKASNGVAFTAEGGIKSSGSGFATIKGDYKKGAVQVDKIELGTSGKFVGEFSMPDVAPSTKATFKFQDVTRVAKTGDVTSAKFGFSTKQTVSGAKVGVSADVDAVNAVLTASALVGYEGVLVGGQTTVNTNLYAGEGEAKGLEWTKYDALVGYQSAGTTVGFQTDKRLSKGIAFFHNAVNRDLTVTGKAAFGLKGSKDVAVDFGGKYKWDSATTVSAAVNKAAEVQLAFEQKVSPMTTLTLFSKIHATAIEGDAHSFGAKLALRS